MVPIHIFARTCASETQNSMQDEELMEEQQQEEVVQQQEEEESMVVDDPVPLPPPPRVVHTTSKPAPPPPKKNLTYEDGIGLHVKAYKERMKAPDYSTLTTEQKIEILERSLKHVVKNVNKYYKTPYIPAWSHLNQNRDVPRTLFVFMDPKVFDYERSNLDIPDEVDDDEAQEDNDEEEELVEDMEREQSLRDFTRAQGLKYDEKKTKAPWLKKKKKYPFPHLLYFYRRLNSMNASYRVDFLFPFYMKNQNDDPESKVQGMVTRTKNMMFEYVIQKVILYNVQNVVAIGKAMIPPFFNFYAGCKETEFEIKKTFTLQPKVVELRGVEKVSYRDMTVDRNVKERPTFNLYYCSHPYSFFLKQGARLFTQPDDELPTDSAGKAEKTRRNEDAFFEAFADTISKVWNPNVFYPGSELYYEEETGLWKRNVAKTLFISATRQTQIQTKAAKLKKLKKERAATKAEKAEAMISHRKETMERVRIHMGLPLPEDESSRTSEPPQAQPLEEASPLIAKKKAKVNPFEVMKVAASDKKAFVKKKKQR